MLPADGFAPTLSKLVEVLERFEIRFHLTGGITSVAYGEPRMTQDVDIVVERDKARAAGDAFLTALAEAGFRFDEQAARREITSGRMFQLLDMDQVIKLDIYVRCLIPGELDRSVRTELFPGMAIPIVARTDAALSKLIWIRHGSHRSRRDLRRILSGATSEELSIVRSTAEDMNLTELLDEVLAEQDEIDI